MCLLPQYGCSIDNKRNNSFWSPFKKLLHWIWKTNKNKQTQIICWENTTVDFWKSWSEPTLWPWLTLTEPAFPVSNIMSCSHSHQRCISLYSSLLLCFLRTVCVVERRAALLVEPIILMRLILQVLIELLVFFSFALRSCASGLISCCRPPLSPSLYFSQSKKLSNSNWGAWMCPCVFTSACLCVCTKAEKNVEHWEQLTSVFFSALLLIAWFSQSAEKRTQNKHEQ